MGPSDAENIIHCCRYLTISPQGKLAIKAVLLGRVARFGDLTKPIGHAIIAPSNKSSFQTKVNSPCPEFIVKPWMRTPGRTSRGWWRKHNGVWGGCWCMAFSREGVGRGRSAQNRSDKGMPRAGGPGARRWCMMAQQPSAGASSDRPSSCPASSTSVPIRPALISCLTGGSPAFRGSGIPRPGCLFCGAGRRAEARSPGWVAARLKLSGTRKGGRCRSPFCTTEPSLFERHGFQRTRQLGKNHWVVTRVIDNVA